MAAEFPFDTKQAIAKKQQTDMLGRSFMAGLPTMNTAGGFGAANVPGSKEAKLNLEAMQGLVSEQGTPNPSGFTPSLPTIYGEPKTADTTGFYAINKGVPAIPEVTAELPAATAAIAPTAAATPEGTATTPTAGTTSQAIIDWANQAPTTEQKGTRLALAAKMMGAEAQTASAAKEPGGRSSLQGIQDIGVETAYNELGMPVQTTKRTAIYDPASNTMIPIKLPTIAAKAPLPPKTELKAGQNYPGYGMWTGTGFRPQ